MMDEQLIDEVAQHGVIFNRQKYYLNGSNGSSNTNKYETKDEAWQTIATKLRSDVETCKKRWKYLRERYVSQRKQGDPPVYEHLSRPYLEKMKFLDQHIQPRKSYRNVPNFLTSPHSANSSNYSEYNMDSKSNGSMKNMNQYANAAGQHHYHQSDQHTMNALSTAAAVLESGNSMVKIEADQVFRDFAAAVASQQIQQMSQSQMHGAIPDSSQSYSDHFRDGVSSGMTASNNCAQQDGGGAPSSSSSMKSPQSSPLPSINSTGLHGTVHHSSTPQQVAAHSSSQMQNHIYNSSSHDELDSSTSSNFNMKKPRVQLNNMHAINTGNSISPSNHSQRTNSNNLNSNSHFGDDSEDESDNNSNSLIQTQNLLNDNQNNFNTSSPAGVVPVQRTAGNSNNQTMFSSNADFLFQLYQQLPHQQQTIASSQHLNKFQTPQVLSSQRSSEHLLGELVTTELLKMTKDRRRHVQKKILEILFFDD